LEVYLGAMGTVREAVQLFKEGSCKKPQGQPWMHISGCEVWDPPRAWVVEWAEAEAWAEAWVCKEDMPQIKVHLPHPLMRSLEHSRRRQKPWGINLIRFYPG